MLHPHTHLRRDTFSKPHITLYLNWQPHFSKIWPQLDSNISKCLSDKTQCGTSLKIPLGFFEETQLCKIWKSFAFFSRFFQPNLTFQNMKIVCIFPKVFSRKPNLHKTWKQFFFWGFFKDLLSILVFLSKVLEFKISCFLRWKKWDHWTFNTQCHNFFLTLWMQHQNGKGRHFFLHIYSFTQIYSSMVMVSALKALDESEKTKNLPVCCVVFLILFCCFLCV